MREFEADLPVGVGVYEALRRDIVFGRLRSSQKLKLDTLRRDYGASIATLREALNRLASEGFVQTEGQRGFFVADMSRDGLREIADLRILLECHALQLSFEAGDMDWEAGIVAAHYKLSRMESRMQEGDETVKERWKQFDWEFHQALILGCGSRELLTVHRIIFDKYLRYQMRALTFRGSPAAREHRDLLDAALARDSAKGQAILQAHIEGGVEHCLAHPSEPLGDI